MKLKQKEKIMSQTVRIVQYNVTAINDVISFKILFEKVYSTCT